MESAPEVLFKYLPPSRANVLQDLLIRFTQASSLNDTLELRPPIKGVAAPEKLEQIARNNLPPTSLPESSEQKRRILGWRIPGMPELLSEICLQAIIPRFAKAVEQRHERNPHAIFDVTDQNFGILSLTEVPADVRMWAHYADSGRGLLIEFDPEHPWFHAKREERDSFYHLRQVNYVSSRPVKYLLEITESEFLYTKWSVWQDEKEWRIIRNFNDGAKIGDRPDPYGNSIILFSIPPTSITSVVLGFSASNEFEKRISAILSGNANLGHVSLKRAVQSRETGQVEIVLENRSRKTKA